MWKWWLLDQRYSNCLVDRRHSMFGRSKAFLVSPIESIPRVANQRHSSLCRLKAFHTLPIEGIPCIADQMHSTHCQSKVFHALLIKGIPHIAGQRHSMLYRSKAFHALLIKGIPCFTTHKIASKKNFIYWKNYITDSTHGGSSNSKVTVVEFYQVLSIDKSPVWWSRSLDMVPPKFGDSLPRSFGRKTSARYRTKSPTLKVLFRTRELK